MRTYTKSEVKVEKFRVSRKINSGEIFVYPTDTIYGIGCNAMNDESVKKVREIRKIGERPMGIIAPNKRWIYDNCIVPKEAEEWIDKLPGPITLVFQLKNKKALSKHVNPQDDKVMVRIPAHWVQNLFSELNIPIITPPANIKGKNFMTSLENLDKELKSISHFAIYEGEKKGFPSKMIRFYDG